MFLIQFSLNIREFIYSMFTMRCIWSKTSRINASIIILNDRHLWWSKILKKSRWISTKTSISFLIRFFLMKMTMKVNKKMIDDLLSVISISAWNINELKTFDFSMKYQWIKNNYDDVCERLLKRLYCILTLLYTHHEYYVCYYFCLYKNSFAKDFESFFVYAICDSSLSWQSLIVKLLTNVYYQTQLIMFRRFELWKIFNNQIASNEDERA